MFFSYHFSGTSMPLKCGKTSLMDHVVYFEDPNWTYCSNYMGFDTESLVHHPSFVCWLGYLDQLQYPAIFLSNRHNFYGYIYLVSTFLYYCLSCKAYLKNIDWATLAAIKKYSLYICSICVCGQRGVAQRHSKAVTITFLDQLRLRTEVLRTTSSHYYGSNS